MLEKNLRSKIDKLWDLFWSGGIANPLTAIEQISYLIFMKRLDEVDLKRKADVEWAGEPDWYDSSPIAARPYCAACGTSLGFRFKEGSDKMDLTVASFDKPGRFVPKHHFGAESIHRAWLNTDGLPEMRTEDYDLLVKKWVDATGKVPE